MSDVVGVLLAGGLARRMGGGDKGLSVLGGRPMMDRIIERVRGQVSTLILNANGDPERFAGYMYMHGIEGGDKIFYTTGRLTSEMVIKAVQMGIPIVASRSGFTAWGVDLARQVGLTLIGRARGRRFVVLSGQDRIIYDAENTKDALARTRTGT